MVLNHYVGAFWIGAFVAYDFKKSAADQLEMQVKNLAQDSHTQITVLKT